MPFFRLTLKRRLLDNSGKLVEPGMWADIAHINPHVPWANIQFLDNVISQFKFKYNVDLPRGKISFCNFDVERLD